MSIEGVMKLIASTALMLPCAAFGANPVPGLHPEEAYPDNIPPMASPGPYTAFIKQVQEKLHGYGFDAGPISGDFGPKTQAALAQFQLSRLVPASGMLDERTLSELGVDRAAEQSDSVAGSSAGIPDWQTLVDDAATIETGQRALRAAGYDAGPADGTLNARTVAAVKQAQKDPELEPTGELDRRTLAALGIDVERSAAAGGSAPGATRPGPSD